MMCENRGRKFERKISVLQNTRKANVVQQFTISSFISQIKTKFSSRDKINQVYIITIATLTIIESIVLFLHETKYMDRTRKYCSFSIKNISDRTNNLYRANSI